MEFLVLFLNDPLVSALILVLTFLGGIALMGWRIRSLMAKKREHKLKEQLEEEREIRRLGYEESMSKSLNALSNNINNLGNVLDSALNRVGDSIQLMGENVEKAFDQVHEERMAMINNSKDDNENKKEGI